MASLSPKAYLFRYGLIGAAIAFAGPPIYIHAPKVYADFHSVNLAVLGAILLAIRAFDFIQDPILGWWIAKSGNKRLPLVALFSLLLGVGMTALFAPNLPIAAGLWFAGSLALVFTGFSGLQILFYSAGLGLADHLSAPHARIAAWRETSVLIGVCLACVAPSAFALFAGESLGYGLYALVFLTILGVGFALSRPIWRTPLPPRTEKANYKSLLQDSPLRWLLGIGFLNSLPTGITSTLFLFYVEDRLGTKAHAGPMLLTFFLFAALSAPFWGKLAAKYSAKSVLLAGMALAIPAFITAAFLGTGDIIPFYIVCILSGITLGADMTILPAMLSARLELSAQSPAHAFGFWGFITKMSFALGAGIALPLLAFVGYKAGQANPEPILFALALTYAGLPCLLKVLAIIALKLAPAPNQPV